ncbi:MAG: hypothetical protein ACYDHP_08435 [Ferrimicrobium sp.]
MNRAELNSLRSTYEELGRRLDSIAQELAVSKHGDAAQSLYHAWSQNRTLLRYLAEAERRLDADEPNDTALTR